MKIEITDREFHTILAALRLWQEIREHVQVLLELRYDLHAVCTNGESVWALTNEETDKLVTELNLGERDT